MTDLPASVRWQLWIVAFGFFMQSLDTTIVNTALPSMAKSLGESPLHMHMIIVSYVLTVAVMLPASGWLADRVGVRNIFFTAIVLFTAGSLFCAQASTLDQLVMARVLQGVGGAMMVPVGRLTVMKIVPRDQYMAAMTFVTLPGQVGPLLGPALGGVLVEYASWHWIFLINIPVGNRRRNRHPLSDAQLHHADPALRSLWLSAAGRRNGDPDPGARRPERARHFPAWLAGWWPSASAPCCSTCGTPAATPGRCLALTCFATAPSLSASAAASRDASAAACCRL
ncbi:multidrug transporter MdtD [Klebsiella pneumoniae]|uniref:Multidrug transporter MdtD n=1 Tax=Klebsiella pneumoniae TaxID=573 RepID=A0A2X3EYV6_KLEPN|nr:multidrug transporter MdtD [Klebsiella pneumoniae]